MKESTAYIVVLQVEQFAGLGKLTVHVLARDKDNARTAAIEKAEKDGHKVTNCFSVELNG